MDIVVKNLQTEERTVIRQLDSAVCHALISAGIAYPYSSEKPVVFAPEPPTFFVGRNELNGRPVLTFRNPAGQETVHFDGEPKWAFTAFGKGAARRPSEEIVAEYARARDQKEPSAAIHNGEGRTTSGNLNNTGRRR